LQSQRADGLKQAVVTPGKHIIGVVSINTAPHRGLKECFTEVTLRDVAQRNFIIAREDEVVFDIMTRMARRGASIAVVVKGRGRPYASHVTGIISRITSPILSPKVSDLTQENGASYDPREPRHWSLTRTITSLSCAQSAETIA
jgi:hypothetical protein